MRRRLLRILLNAATVLSLVLCAATMAAWVRSYQVHDVVWWTLANRRTQLGIGTCRGTLSAVVLTRIGRDTLYPTGPTWEQSPPVKSPEAQGSQATLFNRLGFALSSSRLTDAIVGRAAVCPNWFIVLLTAILPGAWLAGRRRRQRVRGSPGLCQHCGYDCRATPERCPECGTALVATAATPAREGKGETEGV